jgi:hypothetical protein
MKHHPRINTRGLVLGREDGEQLREVLGDRLPEDVEIDVEVVVDEAVARRPPGRGNRLRVPCPIAELQRARGRRGQGCQAARLGFGSCPGLLNDAVAGTANHDQGHPLQQGQPARRDLDEDELLRLALTKLVEIVGEAAKSISPEGRTAMPLVPWRAAARMRGRRGAC